MVHQKPIQSELALEKRVFDVKSKESAEAARPMQVLDAAEFKAVTGGVHTWSHG